MRESQQKLDEVVFFQQQLLFVYFVIFYRFYHGKSPFLTTVVFFPTTLSKSKTKKSSLQALKTRNWKVLFYDENFEWHFWGGIQTWKPTSPCTPAAKPIREWNIRSQGLQIGENGLWQATGVDLNVEIPASLGGVGYCFNLYVEVEELNLPHRIRVTTRMTLHF